MMGNTGLIVSLLIRGGMVDQSVVDLMVFSVVKLLMGLVVS